MILLIYCICIVIRVDWIHKLSEYSKSALLFAIVYFVEQALPGNPGTEVCGRLSASVVVDPPVVGALGIIGVSGKASPYFLNDITLESIAAIYARPRHLLPPRLPNLIDLHYAAVNDEIIMGIKMAFVHADSAPQELDE